MTARSNEKINKTDGCRKEKYRWKINIQWIIIYFPKCNCYNIVVRFNSYLIVGNSKLSEKQNWWCHTRGERKRRCKITKKELCKVHYIYLGKSVKKFGKRIFLNQCKNGNNMLAPFHFEHPICNICERHRRIIILLNPFVFYTQKYIFKFI